ncbi:hypothetical protein BASA61_003659 [Batrachochytrium salamandrivorans]|nr:hypothetical protein BASA61_003659 [Batrachochytrium salamandrivorans]
MSLGSGGGRRRSTGASAASLTAAATAMAASTTLNDHHKLIQNGIACLWKTCSCHRPVTMLIGHGPKKYFCYRWRHRAEDASSTLARRTHLSLLIMATSPTTPETVDQQQQQ